MLMTFCSFAAEAWSLGNQDRKPGKTSEFSCSGVSSNYNFHMKIFLFVNNINHRLPTACQTLRVLFSNIMDGLHLVMNMKVNVRLAAELEREKLETGRDLEKPISMTRHTKECQTPRTEVGLISPSEDWFPFKRSVNYCNHYREKANKSCN